MTAQATRVRADVLVMCAAAIVAVAVEWADSSAQVASASVRLAVGIREEALVVVAAVAAEPAAGYLAVVRLLGSCGLCVRHLFAGSAVGKSIGVTGLAIHPPAVTHAVLTTVAAVATVTAVAVVAAVAVRTADTLTAAVLADRVEVAVAAVDVPRRHSGITIGAMGIWAMEQARAATVCVNTGLVNIASDRSNWRPADDRRKTAWHLGP